MMKSGKSFHLTIMSGRGKVFETQDALSVIFSSYTGQRQILAGHIDMVCMLKPCLIEVEVAPSVKKLTPHKHGQSIQKEDEMAEAAVEEMVAKGENISKFCLYVMEGVLVLERGEVRFLVDEFYDYDKELPEKLELLKELKSLQEYINTGGGLAEKGQDGSQEIWLAQERLKVLNEVLGIDG